ncbi:hypothetical protein CFE70_006099 [Pyrenophora teres f. teres 0-1]
MTSIFTFSSSSDEEHITNITTSVSRNISSGNAVQINGPVADKIYNVNLSNGRRQIVRAVFGANVSENFVSHRIVKRLKLESHKDHSVAIEATWGLIRIPHTNDYVNLACRLQEGNDCVTHRFYVVKLCSFDLLFSGGSIKYS